MVQKSVDKNNVYNKSSFYAQVVSGLVIMYCIYLYVYGTFSVLENLIILLLFSISIGIHGLAHLFMELNYNWNPFENYLN